MPQLPTDCSFRTQWSSETGEPKFSCEIVRRETGVQDAQLCQVELDACKACCQCHRSPAELNPVIASLVYATLGRIISRGDLAPLDLMRAKQVQAKVTDHLGVVVRELDEEIMPPARTATYVREEPATATKQFDWAVGLLTAPRAVTTLESTLESLDAAGFDQIHVFAEPGSRLPQRLRGLRVTHRATRFGNILNFFSCLCSLLKDQPSANAYAVFQDDISAAVGLRQWCEQQLWPLGNGLASLFTPRIHVQRNVGWSLCSPGSQRVCGAQALVFRRDVLEEFLSHPFVLDCVQDGRRADDEVLGGWLAREGKVIAYHTPSLIHHHGHVSSIYQGKTDQRNFADGVQTIEEVDRWQPPPARSGRLGLVGWNTPTGLGSMNRDIVRNLPIDDWFIPGHPWLDNQKYASRESVRVTSSLMNNADYVQWLSQLDWLVFSERPCIDVLPRLAAHAGVGVACIPMWEWIFPELDWLQFVDLMICPTELAYRIVTDWKRRYGFGWKTVLAPWPLETQRFPFRLRTECREFLFVNGWGGGYAKRPDGSSVSYQRKGLGLIIEAARLAPDLRFVVRSQASLPDDLPSNIRVADAVSDNVELYNEGDVCVQPSHYEGLGMQLLECQAAGMPLVTTAGAPMNEANAFRLIPTSGKEVVNPGNGFISCELISPQAVVETLRPLVGADIRQASHSARQYVASERNWATVRPRLLSELLKR